MLTFINVKTHYFYDILGISNFLNNPLPKKQFPEFIFLPHLERRLRLPDKEMLLLGLTALCYFVHSFSSLPQPACGALTACIGRSWDSKFSMFSDSFPFSKSKLWNLHLDEVTWTLYHPAPTDQNIKMWFTQFTTMCTPSRQVYALHISQPFREKCLRGVSKLYAVI